MEKSRCINNHNVRPNVAAIGATKKDSGLEATGKVTVCVTSIFSTRPAHKRLHHRFPSFILTHVAISSESMLSCLSRLLIILAVSKQAAFCL